MEFKPFENWDDELVEKQRYFSILKPLVDMEDLRFGDHGLVFLTDHYDAMAITLSIISIVIEHTRVLMLEKISGITRDCVYQELAPLLEKILRFYKA